jgi:hypothetical protein
MIEQSIVRLPELVKDIDRPVSIYLVHLSRVVCPRRRLDGSSIVGRKDDANHGAGGAVGVFPDFVIVVNVILALSYPPDDQGV